MRPHGPAETATACTLRRPVRVLLAEDHAITLWGLRQLVDSTGPRMSIAGTASTCAELLAHPALPQTDVVLLDLGLGDANAINCVTELVSNAGVKVVLLTGDLNPSHHRDAVMRGARGVVLKSQPAEHILDAIERVHAGDVWFDGSLMSLLLGSLPDALGARRGPKDDGKRRLETLTPKERLVIETLVKHRGAKSLVVADALGISENTLRNHLTVIYSKLGVRGKLDLYVYAIEHRLAPAPASIGRPVGNSSQWGRLDSAWGGAL